MAIATGLERWLYQNPPEQSVTADEICYARVVNKGM